MSGKAWRAGDSGMGIKGEKELIMRRHFLLCVSFIIMVFCMFPAASAAADELPAAYLSDFSSGPDGWYGRGSTVISVTKGKTQLTKDCIISPRDIIEVVEYAFPGFHEDA